MKIFFRLLLLAVLGAAGFWLWTVLFPSPEKVVLKKISKLAAVATFVQADSNLTRAGKASSVVSFFAPDAQIVVTVDGIGSRTFAGREEIRETALAGFAGLQSLNVKFLDAKAKILPGNVTATVNCTCEIKLGGQRDMGVQEIAVHLKKLDGDWLITSIEPVKTLQ
jgi:ketosteroid isomerase-like protein